MELCLLMILIGSVWYIGGFYAGFVFGFSEKVEGDEEDGR